jgi:hypothetical protein
MTGAHSSALGAEDDREADWEEWRKPLAVAREIGVRQENLSQWLREVRSPPRVASLGLGPLKSRQPSPAFRCPASTVTRRAPVA